MFDGTMNTIGGLGVFLIGMHLMTGGLRKLAGDKLRAFLARFTHNNVSGVMTGACTTAVIQSSSATTITAVGFVNAGLMRFTQALAIVIGANIGTTVTGWLVAGLGFKLKLLLLVQPLIFAGAFLVLFFKGKAASAGKALAGFGLIFVGLSMMQSGMSGMTEIITPDSFPGDTGDPRRREARILLVMMGIAITLITQSSSAGVAMAVTALNTGTLNLYQAAAMIIGMDIGTTFTAYLATVGATIQAKRTGYAHVIYNILTGIMAFIIMIPFFNLLGTAAPDFLTGESELVLVCFHTSFNALGVLLILPFMKPFAELLQRIVPDQKDVLTAGLENNLKNEPELALSAVNKTLLNISASSVELFLNKLSGETGQTTCKLLDDALMESRDYIAGVALNNHKKLYEMNLSAAHIIDHLDRMIVRLSENEAVRLLQDQKFDKVKNLITEVMKIKEEGFSSAAAEAALQELSDSLHKMDEQFRKKTFEECVSKVLSPGEAMDLQDTMRWLERNVYHLWRISYYFRLFEKSQNS